MPRRLPISVVLGNVIGAPDLGMAGLPLTAHADRLLLSKAVIGRGKAAVLSALAIGGDRGRRSGSSGPSIDSKASWLLLTRLDARRAGCEWLPLVLPCFSGESLRARPRVRYLCHTC